MNSGGHSGTISFAARFLARLSLGTSSMPEETLPANEEGKGGAGAPTVGAAVKPGPGIIKRIDEKVTAFGPLKGIVIAVFLASLVAVIAIVTLHFASGYFGGQAFFRALLISALVLVSTAGIYVVIKQERKVLSVRGALEKREAANERLALLLEAGRELGSTLDRKDILEKMLDYAVDGTGNDMGAVYLADRHSSTLDLAMTKGVEEQKVIFKQFPMGKGLIGEAAAGRRMLAIDDTSGIDERNNVFYGAATACSQVVVPLVAREKFVGVLVVARKNRHRYSEGEKALLWGLAELSSLSVANAQLYRIARRSLDVAAQQKGFAASILDQMVAGVITADKNGRIAVFNKEAQRLTGYAFAEKTQALLRPELSIDLNPLGPLEQGMLDVLSDPTRLREGEALIMKKDGSTLPVSYRVYPLSDGTDVLGSAAVFMESRSGSREIAREDRDYQPLLRSLGARVERLYTHPLSRVLDRVKGMDVDSWSRSRDDITRILEAGSAALTGLLEGVEQYLNCITTREWDSKEEHALPSIITDVVDGLVRSGQYKDVVVLVNISSLPPAFGYGRLIRTACEELMENAMVASAKGGKKVEVTGREENDMVRIEVRDTGPGLTQAEKDSMFRPFFTTMEGNSGLGLSIVERVMERLGGAVGTLESRSGAVFYLDFPKVKKPQRAGNSTGIDGAGTGGERG